MFEHFALRAAGECRALLETITIEEQCKQHEWRPQSQILKSHALDRRAATICLPLPQRHVPKLILAVMFDSHSHGQPVSYRSAAAREQKKYNVRLLFFDFTILCLCYCLTLPLFDSTIAYFAFPPCYCFTVYIYYISLFFLFCWSFT